MGMRSRSWLAGLVFFLSLSEFAAAAPLAREAIPEPLKTWVPWVLHGAEEQLCPYVYNDAELHQCSWPSRIALNIGAKGGTFTQDVAAFRTLWMPLPGDAKHWPQGVKLDGKPAPVVPRDQLPGLVITAGTHSLSGSFDWQEMPENLPLPRSVGLVALSLNGAQVSAPNLDEEGRLWLKQQATSEAGATRVDVRVHRLVSDNIPFVVTTHIELSASGKSQEIVLPNALLPGFIPLSLNSRLPARVEPLGKLRVQVRPGRWEITLAGRNQAQQKAITLPKSVDPLAASEEVWAFEAHNELRLVTLEGAPAIDPQQTTLPQEWKRFPAYSMQPGQTLKFVETKRGDPLPAPDQLRLQRNLWLDFDGRGYTVQDTIDGTISRAWRLQMAKPQMLGRAAVDGADQYITQTSANDDPGIELRQGRANISADSRLESGSGKDRKSVV